MSYRKTNKYAEILKKLRKDGIKIYHRKLYNADGFFDYDTRQIIISKQIRDTITGCFVLFHEYGHYLQSFDKKFHSFMVGYDSYSEKAMKEIIFSEKHASKFAKKEMKKIGFKYKPLELTRKHLPAFIKYWKKVYFETGVK